MASQNLVPGAGFVNETETKQNLVPGAGFLNETVVVSQMTLVMWMQEDEG